MPPSSAWDRLYQTAETQSGLFTLSQAETCGYSSQHLQKHLRTGRIFRLRRRIYRLAQFPAGEHEDLVELWLWSDRVGVFSHETSLLLHDLSDALPAKAHLTVPAAWSAAYASPEIVEQALREARQRGLITVEDRRKLAARLRRPGGAR